MENRVSRIETECRGAREGDSPIFASPRFANGHAAGSAKIGTVPGPQPIGAVLAELLAQYQARFPEVRIAVVETPAAAI